MNENKLINDFLIVMKEGFDKDIKTIKAYNICLNEMKKYMFEDSDFTIEDLKKLYAEDYMIKWLQPMKDSNMSVSSLNQRISCLRSFYKWLIGRGELMVNIPKSIPLLVDNTIKTCDPLNLDQCKQLLNHVEYKMNENENINTVRSNLIVSIFLGLGLRIDEVHNLNVSDFNYEKKCLHLKVAKFNKERLISVPDKIFNLLDLYLSYKNNINPNKIKDNECLLLSRVYKRLSKDQIRILVYKEFNELGFEGKDIHSLRKSYVTNMIDSGCELHEVARQVGHKNINTTLNIYNRPTLKDTTEFNILNDNNVRNSNDNVIKVNFA